MSWDNLLQAPELPDDQQKTDLDKLFLRVFSTRDGKKLLGHLRQITIEQPTWFPGEDPSHGFAREGQNSMIRDIERRMARARSEK
jgi:hypothetical protein